MKQFLENLNKYWVAPMVAIVGAVLGIYFTVVKDSLEAEAVRISNTASAIESNLKQREFGNNIKIQMYSEVKEAIMTDDEKLQNAVLLLVNEMLADDSLFREQLIRILLSSPNTDQSVKLKQREIEIKNKNFIKEEAGKITGAFTIDIFYLEEIIQESKPRAKKMLELLQKEFPDYRIRLRVLPQSVNAKSGYRISANQIRFENNEREIAEKIVELVKHQKIFEFEQLGLKEINPGKPSPNYLSIFIRNM